MKYGLVSTCKQSCDGRDLPVLAQRTSSVLMASLKYAVTIRI